MARPPSPTKRLTILTAATRLLSERGIAATPTSAISRAAGIAEGTLFTYFATKDILLHALYRDLHRDLAREIQKGFPRDRGIRAQCEHAWDATIEWGLRNPHKNSVLEQLRSGFARSDEARQGEGTWGDLEAHVEAAMARGELRELPPPFFTAGLGALAEMTRGFMARDQAGAEQYRQAGFALFWGGVAVPPTVTGHPSGTFTLRSGV